MKKHLLYLGLTIVITMFSCSTDKNYPQKYSRSEFSSGVVKMYTKTGEVTDAQVINQFSEEVRNFFLNVENAPEYVYSFDDDIDKYEDYNLEIIFSSETKGEISFKSNDSETNETIKFNLIKRDDYYVLSIQDTVVSSFYSENPRFKCVPEITNRTPIPMGGEIVSFLKPLYIKKTDDEIYLFIVSYMEKKYFNNELNGIAIEGVSNNMINMDYLEGLKYTNQGWVDSIAYKESFIIFK
jgi:hypothetical protein